MMLRCASVVLLLAAASCEPKDTVTQVSVAISSETEIPKELNRLQVIVRSGNGSTASDITHEVELPAFFPKTLTIIPRDEDALKQPVEVFLRGTLRGGGADTDVVLRRAIVSYVEGRAILLPMPLRMACFHIASCRDDETCSGGECIPARVDSERLKDFERRFVFGSAAGADCFDEDRCLASATVAPVDFGTCTFALPPGSVTGERPGVNASIEWLAAPERIIVLDEADPQEGWTVVDPTTGLLSRGVCDALRKQQNETPNKANALYLSTQCPAKRALQPTCGNGIGRTKG
jgi:hypothetical protein